MHTVFVLSKVCAVCIMYLDVPNAATAAAADATTTKQSKVTLFYCPRFWLYHHGKWKSLEVLSQHSGCIVDKGQENQNGIHTCQHTKEVIKMTASAKILGMHTHTHTHNRSFFHFVGCEFHIYNFFYRVWSSTFALCIWSLSADLVGFWRHFKAPIEIKPNIRKCVCKPLYLCRQVLLWMLQIIAIKVH